jgi:integrase
MAIKVKLREKKISGNRQSLYLDFYPAITHPETGKSTRREFLGMYLMDKAKNPIDKQGNKEKMQLAEQIRQKRENHFNKPEIYTGYEKEQLKIKKQSEENFVTYFKNLADNRKASNHANWISAYKYFNTFTKGSLTFAELNTAILDDFKDYLLTTKSNRSNKTTLSQNSAVSYFNKVKATLKQAYADGILQQDLNAKVKPIKEAETRRHFLTYQELTHLAKTPCKCERTKRISLFSALTGLRHCDIKKLTWGELEFIENIGYFIKYDQQKTKGVEMLPISEQAYNLMNGQTNPNQMPQESNVFEGVKYTNTRYNFIKWFAASKIQKKITFHCLRHTYSTLQLQAGTDIYTVSKMLGHKDLKTTQIYAKIVDETKRTAANKILLDL